MKKDVLTNLEKYIFGCKTLIFKHNKEPCYPRPVEEPAQKVCLYLALNSKRAMNPGPPCEQEVACVIVTDKYTLLSLLRSKEKEKFCRKTIVFSGKIMLPTFFPPFLHSPGCRKKLR